MRYHLRAMNFLELDRPLAVFDIESTGLNPHCDRIIELAVVKVLPGPDRARQVRTWLFNPGVAIPMETTAIHGITDEMVASAPKFADKAAEILEFFDGCDLGGFGLSKLDIPILEEEFARCGIDFAASRRRMFDALRIYHKREPRDLSAALRFFCGEEPVDAHGAEVDALSALRVLEGEFAKYPDLPTSPDELDRYVNDRDPSLLDREGRFRLENGEAVVNFGRKKGRRLRDLAVEDTSYLVWILHGDFAHDTKSIVREALDKYGPRNRPGKKARKDNAHASAAASADAKAQAPKEEKPAAPTEAKPVAADAPNASQAEAKAAAPTAPATPAREADSTAAGAARRRHRHGRRHHRHEGDGFEAEAASSAVTAMAAAFEKFAASMPGADLQ